MVSFKYIVLAALFAVAQADPWCDQEGLPSPCHVTEAIDSTDTVMETQDIIVPEYTTVSSDVVVTETLMILQTDLPFTESVLITAAVPTVTVGGADAMTSYETEVVTVVTTEGAGVGNTVTMTVGLSTEWVTITATEAMSTVFVTQTHVATVTSTVQSGYVTVSSCIPTTTIISTLTTSVPEPTEVEGDIVSYHKQNCHSVVCPIGRQVQTVGGIARSCTLIYYGANLVSSTCIVEYCCTPLIGSQNVPVIRHTTCHAASIVCPGPCILLSDVSGNSVPCLHSYLNNQLVASTCDQTVCCSAPVSTVTTTVGATNVVPTSSTVSCKTAVKCAVYGKDPQTNYIRRCVFAECSTSLCCQSI